MNFETIKFELKENGIGILTFDKPETLNSMTAQFIEDLHVILDHLMTNLDCRVLILKAEGRVFCAGLDLKEAAVLTSKKVPEELKKFSHIDVPELIKRTTYIQQRIAQVIIKMRKIPQPIIAIIQGAATGGGFALTLASDIRIASEEARFNNAFINVGLSGGRFFGAEEADRIGFVLKVVPKESLLDSALELANEMLTKSPLGLRFTKEAINLSLDSPSLETISQLENRAQIICASSKDVAEAFQAFFEKRKPKYSLK